jgi:hypothetical protein
MRNGDIVFILNGSGMLCVLGKDESDKDWYEFIRSCFLYDWMDEVTNPRGWERERMTPEKFVLL